MNRLLKKAFTLIELLVVIAIIGILSGLIVVSMGGMTDKATVAKVKIFSNSLRSSLMANIVGEWKFDEISSASEGSSIQDSWRRNNGVLDINSVVATDVANKSRTGVDCISGNCLYFDGVDDYIEINTNVMTISAENAWTIAGWVNWNGLTTETIIGISENSTNFIYLEVRQSKQAAWRVERSGHTTRRQQTTAGNLTSGIWHYVTLTKTGDSDVNVYIDGKIDTTRADQGGDSTPNVFGKTWIGRIKTSDVALYYGGMIDDMRIYNAIMPTSQIKEQYYAGLNSLLANGSINAREYDERIHSIAKQ